MKRRIHNLFLSGAILIAGVLLMSSCLFAAKETLEERCNNKAEILGEKAEAFINDMSYSTCEDYKDAMRDYIDACDAYLYYNATWESELESWDCTDFN